MNHALGRGCASTRLDVFDPKHFMSISVLILNGNKSLYF